MNAFPFESAHRKSPVTAPQTSVRPSPFTSPKTRLFADPKSADHFTHRANEARVEVAQKIPAAP